LALHGGELARLVFRNERIDDLVERRLALQHQMELMGGEPDAMVRHPPLRKVVGADALGAVARADLAAPVLGALRVEVWRTEFARDGLAPRLVLVAQAELP